MSARTAAITRTVEVSGAVLGIGYTLSLLTVFVSETSLSVDTCGFLQIQITVAERSHEVLFKHKWISRMSTGDKYESCKNSALKQGLLICLLRIPLKTSFLSCLFREKINRTSCPCPRQYFLQRLYPQPSYDLPDIQIA